MSMRDAKNNLQVQPISIVYENIIKANMDIILLCQRVTISKNACFFYSII